MKHLVIIGGLTGKNLKDKNFVQQVINPITSIKGLVIEPLRSEDFKKAADFMNECKLDYEDSLSSRRSVKNWCTRNNLKR